jgi:hypothetical protein
MSCLVIFTFNIHCKFNTTVRTKVCTSAILKYNPKQKFQCIILLHYYNTVTASVV